ncbi:methylmalonyl Co-A mutase-associated GTPase MeaB [Bacteriovorax sp. Seq25_V]|uniref:methylmalonyl Co-A mutase-associated GTPase MeaB n=1 Tax=Bacteriovorax sp. Seq25_V TaxID=1201288 RepID=UPI00038A0220|nr:methylmalonyl Co-A mutase-associated GTPase MeaB [Bacteriovorax sp. Seq25_V]EQC46795.1 LAO/AO transport system ATPase [Bacteriovorax sp. Seq25_V]
MSEIKASDISAGKIRALSKAITLSESKKPEHQKQAQALIEELLPHTGNTIRIGISGTPGVGKSTFIESLGLHLTSLGKKVAVLAIDPSSPVSGGSILGDKTRMERLSQEPNAYIRPSPTSGTLGGVAQKTREAMLLCEAAGFDVILIETVGVGQSEFAVSDMVDLFTVLLLPGAGDELQGIKKGIIEVSDYILINKAEGENLGRAKSTQSEYLSAMNIMSRSAVWKPRVKLISALENSGIKEYWEDVLEYIEVTTKYDFLKNKRLNQNKKWLNSLFLEMIKSKISENPKLQSEFKKLESNVVQNKSTPFKSAEKMLELLFTSDLN